jgi:hypothetical protein
MGHAVDCLLKLGRGPLLDGHGGEHCQGFGISVALVLVPMAETIREGVHGGSFTKVKCAPVQSNINESEAEPGFKSFLAL